MSNNEPEVTKDIVDEIDDTVMADGILTNDERDLLNRMVAKYKEQEYRKLEPLEDLVKRIEADGTITRAELRELHEAIMEDGVVTSEELMVLQGIVNKLSRGELEEA
ncbi:hypothetical protein ACFL01_00035 [Planctomycetota bacterium]